MPRRTPWLRSPRLRRKQAAGHRNDRRLLLERLEDRTLLAGFNFADFSASGTLSLVGDAAITADNRLRLTPAEGGRAGAAWYTAEKEFVGAAFSTTFQFQLANNFDSPGGSDGFVFIIQNSAPTYLSGGGGTLGYYGLQNSLAVEFDTFQNSEVADPSGSHISVHTNGTGANDWSESLSLGSYNTNPIMDDANVHTAKIAYTAGTLSIYLDDLTTPKLTIIVDIADKLSLDAGRAWVGFTAATGGGWQTHDILNWSLDTTIPATTLSINNVSVIEGNSGSSNLVFTVTRSGDLSAGATVNWTTVNGSATASSGDYVASSGQATFAPDEMEQTITITANGDTAVEAHETFSVKLTSATNAWILDSLGGGTILNDETTIAISDATVTEGNQSIGYLGNLVSAGVGGMDDPYGMIYGPDGLLYVSTKTNSVLRYDPITGEPRPAPGRLGAEFVSPGAGGLTSPRQLGFGPDGNLYVVSEFSDAVLRYDGSTGVSLGAFIAAGTGGISRPRGLMFDANYLYVTSVGMGNTPAAGPGTDSVLRFDAMSGNPAGVSGLGDAVFIPSGSGGLDNPSQIIFHNGAFFVSSTSLSTSNSVLKFGTDGSFQGAFVSTGSGGLSGPVDMVFHGGLLYVTSWANNQVLRYSESTGAFVDAVVPSTGGLGRPLNLLFDADGNFIVSSGDTNEIRRYGTLSQAVFTISLSTASALPVTVNYSTANGSAIAGGDYAAGSGTVTFAPGQTTSTILVKTLDDTVFEGNETFVVNLLNASAGATIADGQGVGTIVDNDIPPTKFYVVDDATTNKTYEYGASGSAVENYAINSGNSAPRGAASTAAGTTVWTVDANKNVYVYNPSGGLLGSWTAGSLAVNAAVEGISTNGTDVWIVDAKQDKVFRYTSAASRLSGSQNAASSFNLNSGNSDAKDLVTDGTNIWVVNDAATDKVFKYNLSGTLLGSWTISTSGVSAPTGITLDPASPSHLWIVDSGTDRVYQYDAAVGRTSGSQAASPTSFALAVGNSNPQGIADPPVGGAPAAEPAASAPAMVGVLAITGTAQAPVSTSDAKLQAVSLLPAVTTANGPSFVAEGRRFMAVVSDEGLRTPAVSSQDEAICSIADELDGLLPVRKLRR